MKRVLFSGYDRHSFLQHWFLAEDDDDTNIIDRKDPNVL